MRRLILVFLIGMLVLLGGALRASGAAPLKAPASAGPARYRYLLPRPGATFVPAGTAIALRFGVALDPGTLGPALFDVVGARSGVHGGRVVLADDRMTAIFKPAQPFASGEQVTVRLRSGLRNTAGAALDPLGFSFTIAPSSADRVQPSIGAELPRPQIGDARPASAAGATSPYLTLPSDFPVITATVSTDQTDAGKLFVASFGWGPPLPAAYLLILENDGQPVYYKRLPGAALVADFKAQPNGLLTYYDNLTGVFHALDSSYQEVGTYRAGNGYSTDAHELQLLPNGHALLMIYHPRPVDMSQIVAGGRPDAVVLDLVIQELDSAGEVVFEWNSKDYFQITDTTEQLANAATIDYAHGNAIELDSDGNLLISSRHMDEITKIDRQTGAIIWRLGGKHNQFSFTNDQPFVHQHDIRRLPSGHLTLFDNRTDQQPLASRAVEYQIDESARTITRVWQYRNTPETYALAMGSVQRLPNGNTLIGWGSSQTTMLTEVTSSGSTVLELRLAAPRVSYRARRLPWRGQPISSPTLIAQSGADTTTLAYSWNGATDVASYKLYGGLTPGSTALLATTPRSGFETRATLTASQPLACFFRVVAYDADGDALGQSELVRDFGPRCQDRIFFFPLVPIAR